MVVSMKLFEQIKILEFFDLGDVQQIIELNRPRMELYLPTIQEILCY